MGDRSLEVTLRRRVLGIAAIALVVVAIVGWIGAYVSLRRADEAAARDAAEAVHRDLETEAAEGDPPDEAIAEVMAEAQSHGSSAAVSAIESLDGARTTWMQTRVPVPAPLLDLAPGTCGEARIDAEIWRGCAIAITTDPRLASGAHQSIVVAAVIATGHAAVVRWIAAIDALVVIVALAGLAFATRRAVHSTTRSLRALVGWSESVALSKPPASIPRAAESEINRLGSAFETLIRRLFDALDRERTTGAHIAHELRTPLTAIAGELELPPRDGVDSARIVRIEDDVRGLARVIDAILYLARPAAEGAHEVVVNVADVARELADEPTVVVAPDEALVRTDPALVELAMRNLLENAEKHGGSAAESLTVTREGAFVRVAVIDDGPGVSDDARAKMFDRFWRANERVEGSGLGLALVRAVAERHGGSVGAHRGPGGKGLVAWMTLGPILDWSERSP